MDIAASVNSQRILLAHPTGSAFSRNAALAFAESGRLAEFWTCVAWNTESMLHRMLPGALRAEAGRRSFPVPVRKLTRTSPWRELGRLLAGKLHLPGLTEHERGVFCVDAVYKHLDDCVARRIEKLSQVGAVYGYEDGALHTFRAATRAGLKRIYDLPIGYWRVGRKIQEEEAALKPEWASTLSANLDSAGKLERKDRELELAETIIVASRFTLDTLADAPKVKARIKIVPYGAPPVSTPVVKPRSGKLKALFVGILSQRKGISYVFDAVKPIADHVDLTLIGRPGGRCPALERELSSHRWIPSLPHAQILEEMERHDVLLFPSLFEGFGLVILEAMSRGLPVITTSHTAGPDIIKDGVDGFIVPIRSAEAITQHLTTLMRDRERLQSMGEAARRTAAGCSWENYRRTLVDSVLC
jgi:glycosyltransferase involved in cell wall biosynthesis